MTLPAIFLGHGSPMNAIDPASRYNRAFLQTAAAIAKPQAILMISAHWIGRDLRIMSGVHNPILYDFHGFPAALYEAQYPAPGAPELAARVGELLAGYALHADPERGLDHGAWAVLRHFYPEADVPVVQLGLNVLQPAACASWTSPASMNPLPTTGRRLSATASTAPSLQTTATPLSTTSRLTMPAAPYPRRSNTTCRCSTSSPNAIPASRCAFLTTKSSAARSP